MASASEIGPRPCWVFTVMGRPVGIALPVVVRYAPTPQMAADDRTVDTGGEFTDAGESVRIWAYAWWTARRCGWQRWLRRPTRRRYPRHVTAAAARLRDSR